MFAQNLLAPILYILSGGLLVRYLLVERLASVLLIAALAWLGRQSPSQHKQWHLGISVLAILTSLLAPAPIPVLLLVMALAANLVLLAEKFQPASLHWRSISGLALYCLMGLGVSAFNLYIHTQALQDAQLGIGQSYISVIASVALYGYPLGYLALLAQGLLVHPPFPGSGKPADLVHALRSRKQD